MSAKKSTRVQLDFQDNAIQQLNALKVVTDATTNTDVIRNALMSYAWMVERYQRGERLLVKALNGDVKEVELFGLTVMTLGNRRKQIIEHLKSQNPNDMKIYETDMQLAFPVENFAEAEASGAAGTLLIDQAACDSWLNEVGLKRKGSKMLEGGFGNRYIGVSSL